MTEKIKKSWKLKNLFVAEEEKPEVVENKVTSENNGDISIATRELKVSVDSTQVEKSKLYLMRVLEEKSKNTFDFFKFKKAMQQKS
jgi:hypothetical protein